MQWTAASRYVKTDGPHSSDVDDTVEERIGDRYEILGKLGRGGMASVYRARDARLLRDVAVKVLASGDEGTESLFFFHREARAIAALRHPNIVQIHDYSGADESRAFIVMELITGGNLDDVLLIHHPLPEGVLLATACGVASALAHAHEQGVIHRDIKPANVMIEQATGRVLLTDFGIAKAYRDPAQLGATVVAEQTQLFGTPEFMAPEQLRQDEVGPKTDVFSFGSLVYCLAAGASPFRHPETVEILRRIVDHEYQPLGGQRPDLSHATTSLVDHCLNAATADRPTMLEVTQRLEERLLEQGWGAAPRVLQRFLRDPLTPLVPRRQTGSGERAQTSLPASKPFGPPTAPAPGLTRTQAGSPTCALESTQAFEPTPLATQQPPPSRTLPILLTGFLLGGVVAASLSIAVVRTSWLQSAPTRVTEVVPHVVAVPAPTTSPPARRRFPPIPSPPVPPAPPVQAREPVAAASADTAAAVPSATSPVRADHPAAESAPTRKASSPPKATPRRTTRRPAATRRDKPRPRVPSTAKVPLHPEVSKPAPEKPTPKKRGHRRAAAPQVAADELATLHFRVEPWGAIYVDGRPFGDTREVGSIDVDVGNHEVTIVHPTLGRIERKVQVAAGEHHALVFEFAEDR